MASYIRITSILVLIVFIAAARSHRAAARKSTAPIVDQSQAVLPGATVPSCHAATGIERAVVTGPDGRFVVPTLTPGLYTVMVDLSGFQPPDARERSRQRRPGGGRRLHARRWRPAEQVTVTRGSADGRGHDDPRGYPHQQ